MLVENVTGVKPFPGTVIFTLYVADIAQGPHKDEANKGLTAQTAFHVWDDPDGHEQQPHPSSVVLEGGKLYLSFIPPAVTSPLLLQDFSQPAVNFSQSAVTGFLDFPTHGVAVACRPGDVNVFPSQTFVHGTTQGYGNAIRITVSAYTSLNIYYKGTKDRMAVQDTQLYPPAFDTFVM